MPADRLEGVAQPRCQVAVVEEYAGTALGGNSARNELQQGVAGRRDLEYAAIRGIFGVRRQCARFQCGHACDEAQSARFIEAYGALQPAAVLAHELAKRQGVEEFVGSDEERTGRHGAKAFVPAKLGAGIPQRLPLQHGKARARLDESEGSAILEVGCELTDRTNDVPHHRAPAGPDLGQRHGQRAAERMPGHDQPGADEFSENLADLGRGDEVAAGAEGVAGRVVAVCRIEQANRHVVGHGERPGRFNQPGDLLPEPVHDAGK